MNQLNNFKRNGFYKNGILLFTKENAITYVNICRENSVKILGIDSFLVFNDFIQPSLENSIDFHNTDKNIYDLATDFILERSDCFFFEVVSDD